MNTKSHTKSLATGLLVLGMVAAAPLAIAQTTPPSEPKTEAGTTSPPATGAAEQQPAQSSASGQGTSWADLDADGNGSLSLGEARRHGGLASVFAEADADANGELSADEYRGYIQKQQAEAAQE